MPPSTAPATDARLPAPVAFAAPAGGAARGLRRLRPSRRLLVCGGGIAGAATLAFLAGFVVFASTLDRLEHEPTGIADGIVALTGGAGRIGDAIDLLAKGFAGRLLITGVNERTSLDEIARLNPHQRRLVECCVDLDYRARNTVGNAVETTRWARRNGFDSLIVVTSNYHMPRSLLELERAMPEARKTPFAVVTNAVDAGSWWRSAGTTRLLLAEYAKYLAASVRRRIRDPLSARKIPDRRPVVPLGEMTASSPAGAGGTRLATGTGTR